MLMVAGQDFALPAPVSLAAFAGAIDACLFTIKSHSVLQMQGFLPATATMSLRRAHFGCPEGLTDFHLACRAHQVLRDIFIAHMDARWINRASTGEQQQHQARNAGEHDTGMPAFHSLIDNFHS